MKKYTKADIENFANYIMNFLKRKGLSNDVSIYYNNKRMRHVLQWNSKKCNFDDLGIVIEEDMNPLDYFEYANPKHILSMSFEGGLYEILNYENMEYLLPLFEKYGLYYEFGNAWNLTAFKGNDEDVWETTNYEIEEPIKEKRISIYNRPSDEKLNEIVEIWMSLMTYHKPCGSCIIGDGIHFQYKGQPYFMSTNYCQSDSPSEVIDIIKKELDFIGAEKIWYDCGRMD